MSTARVSHGLNREPLGELQTLVEHQSSSDLDLGPFYGKAESDLVLRRLTRHFHGMRIPQSASIYETLISVILEQRVNLAFVYQVKKALTKTYGERVWFAGNSYSVLPHPAAKLSSAGRRQKR
ncbi:MAG: hypothetical protein MUP80_06795 [Acidobacteriia bacterium]|nr:hypothetical protein [Terriglobia bacterium]